VWHGVSLRLRTARTAIVWAMFAPMGAALAVAGALAHVPILIACAAIPLAAAIGLTAVVARQVRNLGYAESSEEFMVRRGALWRKLAVVPYGRLQYLDVTAGPIGRALGYATLEMHTAAVGLDLALPGLPAKEAAALRDRLVARGEARRSGL
jgi:membrane protein YdbS with pleckstrin-like domain